MITDEDPLGGMSFYEDLDFSHTLHVLKERRRRCEQISYIRIPREKSKTIPSEKLEVCNANNALYKRIPFVEMGCTDQSQNSDISVFRIACVVATALPRIYVVSIV